MSFSVNFKKQLLRIMIIVLLPLAVIWKLVEFVIDLRDMLGQEEISGGDIFRQVLDAGSVAAFAILAVIGIRVWYETRGAKPEGEADKPDDKKG